MDVDGLVANATALLALRRPESRGSLPVSRKELEFPFARQSVRSMHECTAASEPLRDLSARAGRFMFHRLLACPCAAILRRSCVQFCLTWLTQLCSQQKYLAWTNRLL